MGEDGCRWGRDVCGRVSRYQAHHCKGTCAHETTSPLPTNHHTDGSPCLGSECETRSGEERRRFPQWRHEARNIDPKRRRGIGGVNGRRKGST